MEYYLLIWWEKEVDKGFSLSEIIRDIGIYKLRDESWKKKHIQCILRIAADIRSVCSNMDKGSSKRKDLLYPIQGLRPYCPTLRRTSLIESPLCVSVWHKTKDIKGKIKKKKKVYGKTFWESEMWYCSFGKVENYSKLKKYLILL